MTGHHQVFTLRGEIDNATAAAIARSLEPDSLEDPEVVIAMRDGIYEAFKNYCPNVDWLPDELVENLAKAYYTKVLGERKANPANRDMRLLPWEEEADNIKGSWRQAIRVVLTTGELPPEIFACTR